MAKKPNREGNKHNLGWLRGGKGLCMNVSKGQAHTTAKKAQINQNEQTQIDATGRFYSQNNQALTRAKKMTKNLTITTKQVVVVKSMYVKIPDHSNKQNMVREIAENQEGTTRKTCKKQKVQK